MIRIFFTLLVLFPFWGLAAEEFEPARTISTALESNSLLSDWAPQPIERQKSRFSVSSSTQYGSIPPEMFKALFDKMIKKEGWLLQQTWGIILKKWFQLALGIRMEYQYMKTIPWSLGIFGPPSQIGPPKDYTENTFAILPGFYLQPFRLRCFGMGIGPRIGLFEAYLWQNDSGAFAQSFATELDLALVIDRSLPNTYVVAVEAGMKLRDPFRPMPYLGLKVTF